MNERIHQVLDGELDREALSPSEAAELVRVRALIHGVLRAVPKDAVPNLAPEVLARVERLHRGRWRRWFDWFWIPRSISVTWRPIYGFAAVLALMVSWAVIDRPNSPMGTEQPPQVLVQFRFDAPQAREVALAGEFTNWKPIYALNRSGTGVWTVVVPLEPGIHDYAFIVDGERWVPDPMAPAVEDGFGGLNSRVAVLTSDSGRTL